MRDTIVNVLTNEVIEVSISEEEQAKREADAAKAREEANKPQPPTIEERTQTIEDWILEQMML